MPSRVHNPERSAWKGRSYKRGGARVADLRRDADFDSTPTRVSDRESCAANPCEIMDRPTHECSRIELACVYCSAPLIQRTCNGCGKFLSAAEMQDDETRCEECR